MNSFARLGVGIGKKNEPNEPITLTRPQDSSAEILKEDKSNSRSTCIATRNSSCSSLHISASPCTVVDDNTSIYSDDMTSSSDPTTPGSTTSLSFNTSPPLPRKDKFDMLHSLNMRRKDSHSNDYRSFHPPVHQPPSDTTFYSQPCIKVTDYNSYNLSLKDGVDVRYQQIINFGRTVGQNNQRRGGFLGFWDGSRNEQEELHTCVMCGLGDVNIPSQNKDVCKTCDSSFWYCRPLQVVVKFCKGCKNFVTLEGFDEKPDASKCGRCRYRGRMNYVSKKCTSGSPSAQNSGGHSPPVNLDNTSPRSKGRSDSSVQQQDNDDDAYGNANGGSFVVDTKPHAKNSSTVLRKEAGHFASNNIINIANSSSSDYNISENSVDSNDSNGINAIGSGCFVTNNQKRKRSWIRSIFDNLGNKKAASKDLVHDGEEVDNGKSASFASATPSSTQLSISSPLPTSVVQGRRNSESSLLPVKYRNPQEHMSASPSKMKGNTEFDRSRMCNRSGSFDAAINPTKTHDDPLMHLVLVSEKLLTLI